MHKQNLKLDLIMIVTRMPQQRYTSLQYNLDAVKLSIAIWMIAAFAAPVSTPIPTPISTGSWCWWSSSCWRRERELLQVVE